MSKVEFPLLLRKADRRNQVIQVVPPAAVHKRDVRAAEARHRLHQRVENRLEIDGRAADDLEHVGRCRLLV